ncbi:Trp biosynthesis-associated membrane protein [Longispora albida]|uniref:Trp biosynthesis-associated membrane protein n=1 Tax=Longispora albida TaxID=203523 RepID=UPI00035DF23F|nr:Trp biosynthesis-associated membrane protein [Longispora albida]
MTGRRGLLTALLLAVAAAGTGLFLATREWMTETVARPAPLPPETVTRSAADLMPWLPAACAVALAGAGALIATRGIARRVVGVLIALSGLAIVAGSNYGELPLSAANAVCGALVAAAGTLAALRSSAWPVMGARYERKPDRPGDLWDALDRGEDPTQNNRNDPRPGQNPAAHNPEHPSADHPDGSR